MSEVEKTPDPEQAEKARIVKAKAGGFAKGRSVEPVKKAATERIDEEFEGKLDKLARLMTQSFEDAMAPTQPIKTRVDAAHKLMGHLYRPNQTIKVEGDVNQGSVVFNISSVDSMSPEDRALFERARRASEEIEGEIEGEVVNDD